ncbi:hypothetical protein B0H11DRAFT_1991254 [Mycena galericulata]|nr:hypothetical protein B0H11DRAFT_1991254 [Mycena galericulata]
MQRLPGISASRSSYFKPSLIHACSWIYRAIFLSGLVILVYDHLLTMGSEVELIWYSRKRLSTYWFFVVRYLCLVCSATMLVFYFRDLSPESCSRLERGLEAFVLLQESLVVVSLTIRVVSMYAFNLWVLAAFLTIGGVASALALWTIIELGHPQMLTAPGMTGCHTAIPRSSALRLAGAWEAQLTIDLLVFGLTLRRAIAERSVIQMVQGSLINRMARDGVMYFGIIVLANLANVLSLYFGDIIIAGILSWWTTSLSVTLISRLMLNLHRAGVGNSATMDDGTTEHQDIHFVGQDAPRRRGAQDDPLSSLDDV